MWWGNVNELWCRNFFKNDGVRCSFDHDFNFHFALNYLSVYYSWFISNFCFAKHCVVWRGSGVILLEKSFSFWLIVTTFDLNQPVIPCFFPCPESMPHPRVRILEPHGFPGLLARALSTGSIFSWECDIVCSSSGSQIYSGIVSKILHASLLSRIRVCWPARWEGVSVWCPFHFGHWKRASGHNKPNSSALQICWPLLGCFPTLHPSNRSALPEYVCAPVPSFSLLCLSWFNPVHPSYSVTALSSPCHLTSFCYHCS